MRDKHDNKTYCQETKTMSFYMSLLLFTTGQDFGWAFPDAGYCTSPSFNN